MRSTLRLFVGCVLLCATTNVVVAFQRHDPRPSVAVFTTPLVDCGAVPPHLDGVHSCIRGTYVNFAESAGIRVVPMRWDAPIEEKEAMMRNVNGVLFAGGSMDDHPDLYPVFRDRVCEVVNLAHRWNSESNADFAIFSICQGFQMLSACVAGTLDVVVSVEGVRAKMMALNLTSEAMTSDLFTDIPSIVQSSLTDHNSTLNLHRQGVLLPSFAPDLPLGKYFNVLSTNTDSNGLVFVSTMESKAFSGSIMGVQFHPEWPAYDWNSQILSKSPATVEVSQWLSRRLQRMLRRNAYTWPTAEALEAVVVEQHPMEYQGYGTTRYWIGGKVKPMSGNSEL